MTEGISYYRVRENDHLYRILRQHYGNAEFLKDKGNVMDAVMTSNPHIQNPDLIHPGQIIALPALSTEQPKMPTISAQTIPESNQIVGALKTCDRQTLDLMSLFDPNKMGEATLKGIGTSFVGWVDKAASSAISDVRSTGLAYYQMQAKTITRNQYNYRRSVNVRNVDRKLDGLRRLITPGKTTSEVMRVDPHAPVRLNRHFDEIKRLKRIVKVAGSGVAILKVASVADTAVKIKTAKNDQERTVILLDSVASTGGSAAAVALTVFLVGTPTGWLAMAGMVVVGVAGGMVAEAIGDHVQRETLFDENGNRQQVLIDQIW